MKKKLLIGVAALLLFGAGYAVAQNVDNYTEQGGSRTVVGGTLDVVSGGDLDIESGGVFSIAGTDIATELGILSGVTASTADLNATTNFEETISATTSEVTIPTAKTFDITDVSGLQIGNVAVDATAVELNEYAVHSCIADITTGTSDWVVAPHAGDIVNWWSVIDATITGDAGITLEIAATPVTNSAIIITASASAAGDVDTAAPSAANTVTAGQAIEIVSDGNPSGGTEVCFTIVIAR